MNIALFSDCYVPTKNGVVTVILQLRECLRELGHNVYIVTVHPDVPVEEEKDVYRVAAAPIGMGTDHYFGFPSYVKLMNFLKEKKVDLIHAHTEFSMGHAAYRVARMLKIPAIITTHTQWEDYYEYYLPMGKIIPIELVRKWLQHFFRKFYALINVSSKAYNYFKKDFMTPEMKAAVIPNSIEPSKFRSERSSPEHLESIRAKYGISPDDVVMLFVGRVAKEKRIFELLDVCISAVNKNKSLKLVCVGSGPALDPLQRLAEKDCRSGKIIFTGFVNWFEVHSYYEMSDMFVTASLSEMHSMTILESLLSGLPVAARNDESFHDTVIHNTNGLLADSEEELEKAILYLAENPDRRRKFGQESLKIAEGFSPKVFGKKHERFYQEVIKSFPKPIDEQKLRAAVESITLSDTVS